MFHTMTDLSTAGTNLFDRLRAQPLCTKCKRWPRQPGQRWCKGCRNEWSRANRPDYADLTPDERTKDCARSVAGVYKRRGLFDPSPVCERCGGHNVEMHHADYERPLDVVVLCRRCHLAEHDDCQT